MTTVGVKGLNENNKKTVGVGSSGTYQMEKF